MAGESSQILETIQPAITLLGLGIGAALVSRACRLSPIVGYLGLGLGLAALGLADDFSGPVVATLAEAGVMFLLFNLGLHFSLGRIRAEAANIFGFGTLQMLVSGGRFTALFLIFGLPTEFAIIGGFALVIFALPAVAGLVEPRLISIMVTAIAISLAVEPNPERFEVAVADGYHVHQANPADPRSWDAMGMGKREVVVIATNNVGVSRELTPLVQERLPGIARVIALPGPDGLEEFAELGMLPVDVKAPRGEEQIIEMVFQALGRERKLPVNDLTEEDRALEFA